MESKVLNQFCAISVLFVILIVGAIVSANNDEEDWRAFKLEYEKVYENIDEERRRFAIFVDNKRHVESANTKAVGLSFTQGINSLSDLTAKEIHETRNGFRLRLLTTDAFVPDDEIGANATNDAARAETALAELGDNNAFGSINSLELLLRAPNYSIDWRSKDRVSPVKDQGACGSCWAFATTGALEAALRRHNITELLSEQNLVDCSNKFGNHGCAGGLPTHALRYVQRNGIDSSKDYPYTAVNGKCAFKKERSVMSCRSPIVLPRNDENFLRRALTSYGPLPVAVDASARSFHNYKSGVYDDTQACAHEVNHAMLLVGYGRQAGIDYWQLKNSWGRKWGDAGYIKIVRNKNACGIASFAVLPVAL